VELAYYPEVAYIIVSPLGVAAANPVRAFSIQSGVVLELKLEIV
jgi:hypothetical protein